MPELIADGPSIPTRLLNELDNGDVVFFCGAGISAGKPSNLPTFKGLVENLIENNNINIDLDGNELDRVLGLLERELVTNVVRQDVIQQLSKPPKNKNLPLHKALIELSRINPANKEEGLRLVTTNFDRRFIEAGLEEEFVDSAPKLPIPDSNRWRSLVHLHGIISNTEYEKGENLVLTSADFGRAYLTEGWAARFITELFRKYTVVFVGYSLNDPVLRYMIDAIATERSRNTQFKEAFAFTGIDLRKKERFSIGEEWHTKGVVPIIYSSRNKHDLLEKTLTKWARIGRDPFSRINIVLDGIKKMPTGKDDPIVERVVWALNDETAAEALANADPITDEQDYVKLEEWFNLISNSNLFSCPSKEIRIVSGFHWESNISHLDSTRRHLVRWLTKHLHVPQLLNWVLKNGGHLHPEFRNLINIKLANSPSIDPKLELMWSVLVNNQQKDQYKLQWIAEQYENVDNNINLRTVIEDEVIREIAPYLIVKRGISPDKKFQQLMSNKQPNELPLIDFCGHFDLVTVDDNCWHLLDIILSSSSFLSRHAEILTEYLETAHVLSEIAEIEVRHTYSFRKSIAEHEQDEFSRKWKYLINLVRDSYLAINEKDKLRAENLLQRWINSPWQLFHRLALHAITTDPNSDIQIAMHIILGNNHQGLWDWNLRRELLRFLKLSGNRLSSEMKQEIEEAILEKQPEVNDESDWINHEKHLRLHRLYWSGAKINKKSLKLLDDSKLDYTSEPDEQGEFLTWGGKARFVNMAEFAPSEFLSGNMNKLVLGLINKELKPNEFLGLTKVQPIKVVSALRNLTKQNEWPLKFWEIYLSELNPNGEEIGQRTKLPLFVAKILMDAPDCLFGKVGFSVGKLLNFLADKCPPEAEFEYRILWEKVLINIVVEDDCKHDN